MKGIRFQKIFLILTLLFFSNGLLAQNYVSLDTSTYEKRNSFIKDFETSKEFYLKEIKANYDSKLAKYLSDSYTEFSKEFKEQVKNSNFIFEEQIVSYAYTVLEEIKKGNPELNQQKFKILISKSHSLNAFCLSDGTFVLNLGLFY